MNFIFERKYFYSYCDTGSAFDFHNVHACFGLYILRVFVTSLVLGCRCHLFDSWRKCNNAFWLGHSFFRWTSLVNCSRAFPPFFFPLFIPVKFYDWTDIFRQFTDKLSQFMKKLVDSGCRQTLLYIHKIVLMNKGDSVDLEFHRLFIGIPKLWLSRTDLSSLWRSNINFMYSCPLYCDHLTFKFRFNWNLIV